jgi:hypothetical protein
MCQWATGGCQCLRVSPAGPARATAARATGTHGRILGHHDGREATIMMTVTCACS